jgi:hypothetical protein
LITRMHAKGTVFVAGLLCAAVGDLLPSSDRNRLIARISRLQMSAGWGYSIDAPVDADDTAFALRALLDLGVPVSDSVIQSGLNSLQEFWDARTGLYRTFLSDVPPRITTVRSFEGNYLAHIEVNANVLGLLRRILPQSEPKVSELICAAPHHELASSFYYPGPLYALMLLREASLSCLAGKLRTIEESSVNLRRADGSWGGDVVLTAQAVLALRGEPPHSIDRALRWLALKQRRNGSWRTDREVWSFPAKTGETWQAFDTNGVVSTAYAVRALRTGIAALFGKQ